MKYINVGDPIELTDTYTGRVYKGVVTSTERDLNGNLAVFGRFSETGPPDYVATLNGDRYAPGLEEPE